MTIAVQLPEAARSQSRNRRTRRKSKLVITEFSREFYICVRIRKKFLIKEIRENNEDQTCSPMNRMLSRVSSPDRKRLITSMCNYVDVTMSHGRNMGKRPARPADRRKWSSFAQSRFISYLDLFETPIEN